MHVPICDPRQEYLALQGEIDAEIRHVLESGQYILGPNVADLEGKIASYLGCDFAIGLNSGTDALHLALRALGIGNGDEVITTPFTFIATTEAIGMVGATPVFVDIDRETFNIDPKCVEDAITPRTKAILPVHLFGHPCDMDAIMDIAGRHRLRVVEDCAQAIGATYRSKSVGTFGDVGCFSFFPSKNLGCFGDGGMIVTNDRQTNERVEMLRRHGGKIKYHHEELGVNSRLDELQAAVLRIKFKRLPSWNESRRLAAYRYNELLSEAAFAIRPVESGLTGMVTPKASSESSDLVDAVYHQYTILVDRRDELQKELGKSGVGSGVYYSLPLHLQPVHRNLGLGIGAFPVAESVAKSCLSLPMHSMLTARQQQVVVEHLCDSATRLGCQDMRADVMKRSA